ncbi:MAG: hypothetical protein QNL33_12835 [Akkermansiaceae bacterium]
MSDIPHLFHSLEHDEPFRKCLSCDGIFNEIAAPYTVTKVFRGPECVFEYAMCLPCRRKIAMEFSEESRQRITAFFEKNVHLEERSERLGESEQPADWTNECATCRTPVSKLKNYSLACMGFGETMVFDPFPMMVCSDCEQKIQSKISKSTRDQWDKFILDHFEGPPADALKPDGIPVLV